MARRRPDARGEISRSGGGAAAAGSAAGAATTGSVDGASRMAWGGWCDARAHGGDGSGGVGAHDAGFFSLLCITFQCRISI